MLALPGLKALRVASYVSAPEVLAVPKWCLDPQRQRDAIIGTPMPDGSNFFTVPGNQMLLSALAASRVEGSQIGYAGSLSLIANVASDTQSDESKSIRDKAVKEFLSSTNDSPDFCGLELRIPAFSLNGGVALPLKEVEGPLLLLHNCCSEDVSSTAPRVATRSLRLASGAVEIDGEPVATLLNMAGNVSCNWLLPKCAKKGSLEVKFTAGGERALSLRLLTPRCWKQLVGDAVFAPPPPLKPGKPVMVELPSAAIYRLAGVNSRTFNPNLTLTATALFSDRTVGEPVAGVLGHAFTAAELLGGRSAVGIEGVTVRMEDLDVQMMTRSDIQPMLPLFGLCDFRAQTCIIRTMFDDRQKDDGFKTVVHLLGNCETEAYSDQQQLGASSTEVIASGWNGTGEGWIVAMPLEYDAAKAVNAVKRSASVVTFDDTNASAENRVGLGGGWDDPVTAPAPAATPYGCLLVEAQALAGPMIESTPLRIKELVVFIANKDGLDQKIDSILGPSFM